MQKAFNALAGLSFVMSAGLLGAGLYGYSKLPELQEQLIESAKGMVTDLVSDAVMETVPGKVEEMMPTLPTETGPAIPGF